MAQEYFSTKLFLQSFPSLFISLLGLISVGKWLDKSVSQPAYSKYSLLLVSNCVISFKGNVELLLATNFSTMCQSVNMQGAEYNRYIFDNSCFVLFQSVIIGLGAGLVSVAKLLLKDRSGHGYILRIFTSYVVACFVSSLMVILVLVMAIKATLFLRVDPDHIVLPAISSFGDVLGVASCVFFVDLYHIQSTRICVYSIVGLAILMPVLMYISATSKRRIPNQKMHIIVIAYVLSTIAGYVLDFYSKTHRILAALSPAFSGLCGSISYVYLSKKMTSLENGSYINHREVFYTLIAISATISITLAILARVVFDRLSLMFYALFTLSFIIDVYILLRGIDYITKSRSNQNLSTNLSVSTIPLLTSTSDLIGMFFLVSVVKFFDRPQKSVV